MSDLTCRSSGDCRSAPAMCPPQSSRTFVPMLRFRLRTVFYLHGSTTSRVGTRFQAPRPRRGPGLFVVACCATAVGFGFGTAARASTSAPLVNVRVPVEVGTLNVSFVFGSVRRLSFAREPASFTHDAFPTTRDAFSTTRDASSPSRNARWTSSESPARAPPSENSCSSPRARSASQDAASSFVVPATITQCALRCPASSQLLRPVR